MKEKSAERFMIFILSIIACIFSYIILKNDIQSIEREDADLFSLFFWLGEIILKLCFIGLGVFSIFQIIKKRSFGYIIPALLFFFTFSVVIIVWVKINRRDASPTVMKAHYPGDLNGITLILRRNNTYKLGEYTIFGGTEFYGEYTIESDTISLSEKHPLGEDRDIICDKLLLKGNFILLKADKNGIYTENLKLRITH